MAELKFNAEIKLASATLEAIDAATLRGADQGFRPHLGASLIGKRCERALWYTFRWARAATFSPRILRLFARGQREEDNLSALLRSAGITVHQVDSATGRQFSFSACGGHFGGSMDGACVGLPEAPKTYHVLEYKTHGKKSFDDLAANGVKKAKPEHWAQMQCYMLWTGMDRALYVAVCKDDDRLHMERIDFDAEAAAKLVEKAQRVIDAPTPPERIGDATWYECKFCDFAPICHGTDAPAVNCRTCAHSTPEKTGYWSCARNGNNEVPVSFQREGCDGHRYLPQMLEHWAEWTDASEVDNTVTYRLKDGRTFVNGARPFGFSSIEIQACADKAALGVVAADPMVQGWRVAFGGQVVA